MKSIKNLLGVCLLLCILTAALLFQSCGDSSSDVVLPTTTLQIGVLASESGTWSETDKGVKAALELAENDINSHLSDNDTKVIVTLVFKDPQGDTALALEKLKELDAMGIKIVIGPTTSSSVEVVINYADENDILLISPSSTAPSLSIENDNVMRFVPNDVLQAEALAYKMYDNSIKAVLILYKNDIGGRDLTEELNKACEKYNIVIVEKISYEQNTSDFSTVTTKLNEQLTVAKNYYIGDSIAVQLTSFDETKDIFKAADDINDLKNIKWFGMDGNSLLESVTADTDAAVFANTTNFLSPIYINPYTAGDTSTKPDTTFLPDTYVPELQERIKTKIGYLANDYSLIAYDILWLTTFAYIDTIDSFTIENLKQSIRTKTSSFTGFNGTLSLNSADDRTSGGYGFYGVSDTNTWYLNSSYKKYAVNTDDSEERIRKVLPSYTFSNDTIIFVPTGKIKYIFDSIELIWELEELESYFGYEGEFLADLFKLKNCAGVTTDDNSNIYVADAGNHRVIKFDKFGRMINIWGLIGNDNGEFYTPYGIAVDSDSGFCYVIDRDNERVQKFDLNGNFIEKIGSYGNDTGQFNQPTYITVDKTDHSIWVVDSLNHRVQKFSTSGDSISLSDSLIVGGYGTDSDSKFNYPAGITSDSNGYVYIIDEGNYRIKKFNNSGIYERGWGENGTGDVKFERPIDITSNDFGIFVLDNYNIQIFDPFGGIKFNWNGFGRLHDPKSIHVDNSNNIFISNSGKSYISMFKIYDTNDILEKIVGNWFTWDTCPYDITVDINGGTVYVSFYYNNCIQLYDSDFNYIEQWGSENDTTTLYRPERLTIDKNGYVYVADERNYCIKKFDKNGNLLLSFGHTGIVGDTDGYFKYLEGIAVDSSGYVYASDRAIINKSTSSYGSRIQKFEPDGDWISTDTFTYSQISHAEAIAVNDSGYIYVADEWSERIVVLNNQMQRINRWGRWGSGAGNFSEPENIIIDDSGYIYVVDSANCSIQKFTSAGKLVSKWGTIGFDKLSFLWPTGIAVDKTGRIYVADEDLCRLQRFQQ